MTPNPFDIRDGLIAPSILSADFARLGDEIGAVETADFLHLDVMDGHFVPNISFGPPVITDVRGCTDAFLDAHLMISDPLKYGKEIAKHVNAMSFHAEAVDNISAVARQFRDWGVNAGVVIKPGTAAEVLFDHLDAVDYVLIMSVEPGFSGQAFMPEVLAKARLLKPRLRADQRIEIDGGINAATIRMAREAGIDWFVAASAIYGEKDRAAAIGALRDAMR